MLILCKQAVKDASQGYHATMVYVCPVLLLSYADTRVFSGGICGGFGGWLQQAQKSIPQPDPRC